MTRRMNRRFLLMGLVAVLLVLLSALVHQHTGSELAGLLVGVFMFAAFVFLVFLGAMPWLGTLAIKYPIHNTEGYKADYGLEPEKETGIYMSRGWRRKHERMSLRNLIAFGLYIEPDKKS